MSRIRQTALVAGLVLAVAGAVALATLPSGAPSASAATSPRVALRLSFDDGQGKRSGARLTCGGSSASARGYLRSKPVTACRKARRIARFLASKPSDDRLCDQLYGGPAKARIRGTIGSRTIDRRFSRGDGCEIADWDRAGALLPEANFAP